MSSPHDRQEPSKNQVVIISSDEDDPVVANLGKFQFKKFTSCDVLHPNQFCGKCRSHPKSAVFVACPTNIQDGENKDKAGHCPQLEIQPGPSALESTSKVEIEIDFNIVQKEAAEIEIKQNENFNWGESTLIKMCLITLNDEMKLKKILQSLKNERINSEQKSSLQRQIIKQKVVSTMSTDDRAVKEGGNGNAAKEKPPRVLAPLRRAFMISFFPCNLINRNRYCIYCRPSLTMMIRGAARLLSEKSGKINFNDSIFNADDEVIPLSIIANDNDDSGVPMKVANCNIFRWNKPVFTRHLQVTMVERVKNQE